MRGLGERVFRFQIRKYSKEFKNIMRAFGLLDVMEVDPTLHVLRHAMAVFFLQVLEWEFKKVRERGRWGHDKSMAAYQKRHLLVKNEARLTDEQRARGAWLWESPAQNMGLKMPVQLPDSFGLPSAQQADVILEKLFNNTDAGTVKAELASSAAYPSREPAPPVKKGESRSPKV